MTSNQKESGVSDHDRVRGCVGSAYSFLTARTADAPEERPAPDSVLAAAPQSAAEPGDDDVFPFYLDLLAEIDALGLDDVGLAPVADAQVFDVFAERARSGACAGMTYLTDNIEARRSPRSVLPDAQTIVVVALSERRLRDESRETTEAIFSAPELQRADDAPAQAATVSGYAACVDYHDALRKRLKGLSRFLASRFPGASTRAVVDTAPLLEKYWATVAGLGFVGLNTLTISPRLGSRFFLGEVLVSTPMSELCGCSTTEEYLRLRERVGKARGETPFDVRDASERCLTCRRCVNACPTNALVGDRTLDARRCLNYWTIENRDEIPEDIGKLLGGRLFGCDLCQRVCPHNAGIETADPRELPLDAVERLDEETFRRLFRKTPIFRARVEGLKRVAHTLRETESGKSESGGAANANS